MLKAQRSLGVSSSYKSIFLASFFFIFLFSISLVSSTCVDQVSSYSPQLATYIDNGYVIAPVTIASGLINNDLNLFFRVYDINGKIVPTTDTKVNCSAFLFSPIADRQYILLGNENIESISLTGRKATFPKSFINETGTYIWFIGCEGLVNGGARQGFSCIIDPEKPEDKTLDFSKNIILIIILSVLAVIFFIVYLYNKEEYYLPFISGICFLLAGLFSFSGLEGYFEKIVTNSIGVILIGLGLFNLGESIWRFFPND